MGSPFPLGKLVGLLAVFAVIGGAVWWFGLRQRGDPLALGRAAARAGDVVQAQQCARKLEADGRLDEAALVRGELLLQQGEPADALGEFRRVRDQGELGLDAAVLSGRCLLELKDPAGAEQAFHRALDQQPDNTDAHRGLAAIYYDLGNLNQAALELEQVARLDPRDGRPHRLIGLIRKDQGNLSAAVEAYRTALGRDFSPKLRHDARLELAECLIGLHRYPEALEQLDGLEVEPGKVPLATGLRADALIDLGRLPDAVQILDDALKSWPDDPELLSRRGRAYLDAGDPQKGVAMLKKTLEKDPSNYRTTYRLALAYEQLGQSAEAKAVQQQAQRIFDLFTALTRVSDEVQAKPYDPAVRLRAAELCDKLGKSELAKMWRQAAVACQRQGQNPPE